MLTILRLLKRAEGSSPEAFQAHWRERHAELAARLPGLERYVQNATLLSGYRRREPLYDGVEELRFADEADWRAAQTSPAMEAVRADAARFTSAPAAELWTREHVVLDGPVPEDGVKLISFLTRRSDLSADACQRYWRETHGAIAARIPGMRRYVQCHTLHHAHAEGKPPRYDGVPLAWFDDTAALRASEPSAEYAQTRSDEANFLEPGRIDFAIARERVVLG